MLGWIRNVARRIWRAASTSNPAQWLVDWIRGESGSDSGVSIDGKSCLKYAPVWNAVNRICGRMAQLPCVLHVWTGDRTWRRATEHPAYRLLKRRPNGLMRAGTFKELLTYHALIYGNGRAAIIRNGRADPEDLIPLLPDNTVTVLINGGKWHVTKVETEPGQWTVYKFRDENVFHILGLGYDGIQGYPLWQLAKNSWGLGLAAEKQANRLFKNQNVPGLILEAPSGVFPDDQEAMKFLAAFRDAHEGVDNQGKTALLREGIKASRLAATGQESQAIEQRQFQRQDAAIWFLLESILGDEDSVSYNSLEQKNLSELINCLNPWIVKWQEEAEEKLLREREKEADSHFVRFNTGALLRSDTKTTYETLTAGIRGMLITVNEARAVIDLEPVEGGDVLQNPAITPGPAGDDPKPDPEEQDEDPPADPASEATRRRLQAVIASRIRDLAAVERRRVQDLAPERREAWYAQWQTRLTDALGQLVQEGVSRDTCEQLAAGWCEASRSDPDAAECTWQARADGLAANLV